MRTGRGAGARAPVGDGGYPYRGDEATVTLADPDTIEAQPPPPPVPPPDDRRPWPWLLVLLALVVAGIGAAYAYARHQRHHAAAHPATVVVTQAAGPTVSARTKARKPVPKGVLVPSVAGMPVAKAAALLATVGLVPQARTTASSKQKGTVVSGQPPPHTRVARGGKVLLLISNGPALVVVPSLVGQQELSAVSALGTLGLNAHPVQVPGRAQAGTVLAQNPRSGTKVHKGAQVRLNVSKGPPAPPAAPGTTTISTATLPKPSAPLVRVPDVQGLKLAAARSAIRSAGLVTEIRYVPSQLATGTITGQSPSAGTQLRSGSHVFLTVSQGPSSSPPPQSTQQQTQPQAQSVPDVVGLDEATAVQTLKSSGFVVSETDCPTSDQSQDGVVLDEHPAGGTAAPPGSTVAICVGRYSSSG
jgi:beta-lactam-binding protein with PASTA domain